MPSRLATAQNDLSTTVHLLGKERILHQRMPLNRMFYLCVRIKIV